ncbi:hypothetical protein AMAG_07781 [Allomyces macrogynus ATCC 38327]|uniref:Fanconi Anaemia group E protein C-terminal domain-containing protein n=1 Tax=Allomyces macrogynus (strain ATCC 38327) TaxID=578462 RepID=A0A0L0SJB3_ALLM3|nr:hypothetical protein AMAG_07781 [Allomyces macrogynus ATCC 38327]|eukprot:KNE62577.1 hypothetical protein AMAG_07781 [Allomyces macrogynus ATCC 38327]
MEQVVALVRSERLTSATTAPSEDTLHQLVAMLSPFPRAKIQRTEQLPSRPIVAYLSALAASDTEQFVAGFFRPLLAGPATGDYPWLVDLIKPLSLVAKATVLTSLISDVVSTTRNSSTAIVNLHTVLAGTRKLVLPGAQVAAWAEQLARDRGTIKALQSVLRNYSSMLDRDALVHVQSALENATFTHPLLRSALSAVQRVLDGK